MDWRVGVHGWLAGCRILVVDGGSVVMGGPGAELDYRLLGPFEVRRNGVVLTLGGRRQRAVLAILALAANEQVSADSLIEQLWAGDPPPTATATLQAYVSPLRRLLEPDRAPRAPARVLVSRANGYSLVVPAGARDTDRVQSAIAVAQRCLARGDHLAAAEAARTALAEWRGRVLGDFGGEAFADSEVRRWEETRLLAVELLMDADLAAGRHGDVVAELHRLVGAHPLRERLRGQLMLALYRAGRQAEALEVAHAGRRILAEELGLDPDPALRELEGSILRQDPSLAAPAPQVAAASGGAAPDAPPRAAGGSGDLVGRHEERDVLGRGLAAASARTGRVVLIGGEPGIGKTRLAEAFADVAGDRVVWGRCHDTEGAPPFWPWRQVLRSLAADLDDATLQSLLGIDAGVVADVVPEVGPRLALEAVSRPADAEAARFHFFDAVTRLLVETAAAGPLVIVLEDLHWADESSLALLRFVVGAVRGSGLLIVATYRSVAVGDPTLLTGTLGALAREPVVERLVLRGLDRDGCGALVNDVLGAAPADELVDQVLARTGGNPLFIIHLAQLLRPALDRPEDMRSLVRDHVPPAMADLIELQVSGLAEVTRRLLEVAAVVGREVELGLLLEIQPMSFDEALSAMDEAVATGLVAEADLAGSYAFTHSLMREAIVARLGRSRAARLHGQVGDALAARGVDEESLPSLAHHYWEAASVGWAAAALDATTAAAAGAIARFAYEEAERHLTRALRLIEDLSAGPARDRAELAVRMQAASHLMRSRGYAVAEVAVACERARELASRIPAPDQWLVATWGLAAHHLVRGEHAAAMAIGASLLDFGRAEEVTVAAVVGHITTGIPLLYLGRPAEAAGHLEQVLALVGSAPPEVMARFPQDLESGASAFLAWARWALGDDAEAEALLRRAVERAGARGGYDEVFVRMVSAQLGVLRRSTGQVLEDTERMLAVCGELDFRHLAAHARVTRGWALAVSGQPESGLASLEEGLGYFDAHESSARLVHNLTLRAEALLAAGRLAEAEETAARAAEALVDSEERFYEPQLLALRDRLEDPAA